MREALAARSDRDFVLAGPSVLAVAGRHCWGATRGTTRFVLRHPALVVMLVLLGAGLGAVARNALWSQTGRHPAPLLGVKTAESRVVPALPPLPPSRPSAAPPPAATAPPAVVAPAPLPVIASPAPAAPVAAAKPHPARDPIGDMIRAKEAGGASAKPDNTKIASAQRALTKLGHGPLKADGMPGAGTRQAIERFERERGLAVTGELNPRTIKELSLRAGMPIE